MVAVQPPPALYIARPPPEQLPYGNTSSSHGSMTIQGYPIMHARTPFTALLSPPLLSTPHPISILPSIDTQHLYANAPSQCSSLPESASELLVAPPVETGRTSALNINHGGVCIYTYIERGGSGGGNVILIQVSECHRNKGNMGKEGCMETKQKIRTNP